MSLYNVVERGRIYVRFYLLLEKQSDHPSMFAIIDL